MQQAAAAGLPGGFINGPMFYPPAPGFPPQAGRGGMMPGFGMMRPRYPGNGQVPGMPMPPYGAPQGYGMPGYPGRGGGPRPGREEPGSMPVPRPAPPPQGGQARPPAAGAPRPAGPGAPVQAPRAPATSVIPGVTPEQLANLSSQEQKQLLGEVIYMRIAA